MSETPALSVSDLKVHFPVGGGKVVHAVDGISFDIPAGIAFGLVGESGSGKTTAAMACARLNDATDGTIRLGGDDITHLDGDQMRKALGIQAFKNILNSIIVIKCSGHNNFG